MAKCSSCNAPLPNASLLCEYCGIRNDIDLAGIHYYTTHEHGSNRICPRCSLKLKTLDVNLNGTFLIDRCDRCLGLFFDPGELEALLEATVKNVFFVNKAGLDNMNLRRQVEQHEIIYIKCPVCSKMMNRVNFGVKSGVIVDRCREHGVWLDGGELRVLFEWMKLGGKLLDQEHREKMKRKEEERKKKDRIVASSWETGDSSFDEFGSVLRHSDPYLFRIILSAIRFFFTR